MTTRYFIFEWVKKNERKPIVRHTKIDILKADKDISAAVSAAAYMFGSIVGNLNKIDIIKIQEISKEGENIGLPIIPDSESAIIPIKK